MRRILVASDFSTRSDRALRRAVLIAGECGAALTLVHVVDDDLPGYLVDAHREAAAELLEQTARTIADVDGVAAESVVTTGDAFAGILQTAEEVEPDLILVGPHRRQLLDVFVGTTAERTIRRSERPVLMANAVPSGLYRRSLVAAAFDDATRSAVRAARALGFLDRTKVTALHVFDAPAVGMMKRSLDDRNAIDQYVESEERHALRQFESFIETLELPRARPLLRRSQSSPAAAILAAADEQHAELIVVGTSQPKGLRRLLIGSVAQEVLLDAKCDVLVVPVAKQVEEPAQR